LEGLISGNGHEQVMDIINGYGDSNAAEGNLGMHRLIEAIKHMFAVRMNLADPNFVSISEYMSEMLSPSFAKQLRQRILDDTTFPSKHYKYKYEDPTSTLAKSKQNSALLRTYCNLTWFNPLLAGGVNLKVMVPAILAS